MADQARRETPEAETAQIVRFRPRTSDTAPRRDASATPADAADPGSDTASDDFRHRMLVNMAGLACAAALTGAGIWLAATLSDLRKTQDCVLMGRRNCAPIAATSH